MSRRGAARGPTRRPEEKRGFTLEVAGSAPLACGEILGFREALLAAADPRAQAPLRVALLAAAIELDAWLDTWAEDDTQVRRAVTLRRRLDGKGVTLIATLASHGFGVDPSLAVESVAIPRGASAPKITRSGTYLKVDVTAAIGPHEREAEIVIEPSFG